MRYLYITTLFCYLLITSCGWFQKDNKTQNEKFDPSALQLRDKLYCDLSKEIVEANNGLTEDDCDAALFTSLHGLQCDYINPSVFESNEEAGKLCRHPGCTCWDNKQPGKPTSDSGFSKDMATGLQTYYSVHPDKALAKRVQEYGIANKWTVCGAKDATVLLSKCVMPPKIIYRWAEIEKKASDEELEGPEGQTKLTSVANSDFKAHLDILAIITEYQLYGAIGDSSIETIKAQAKREPNNLLFQAMSALFVRGNRTEVAERLLAKFPADRLPSTADHCTSYLYQRDEYRGETKNPDWLPCDKNKIHPGTDYLLASYVLQL